MTVENPIVLVDFSPRDLSRKRNRKIPGEALVTVDSEFRATIARQLLEVARSIRDIDATDQFPAAVKVQLHPKSLAKSNRPYDLLNRVELPVRAVEKPGQLIIAATARKLLVLRAEVLRLTDKQGVFDVSTFVSFELWQPFRDVLGVSESAEASELQTVLRATSTILEVSFFPWMTTNGSVPTEERSTEGAAQEVAGGTEVNESVVPRLNEAEHVQTDLVPLSTALDSAGFLEAARLNERVLYVKSSAASDLLAVAQLPGVRRIRAAPSYSALHSQFVNGVNAVGTDVIPAPDNGLPIVGVLDSGVSSATLESWVVDRVESDPSSYRDAFHGTFVAGLVVSSKALNSDDRFPSDQSLVFDGQILPSSSIDPLLLVERIREVVAPRAESIKVWNCSFALTQPLTPPEYSAIAQEMDDLSRELGVLFVQAAGNFSDWPNRTWPPRPGLELDDGISSPGEAIRSLTVGALSHLGGHVPVGAPTSYSRRGPSFAVQVKPEVSHWGGDVDGSGAVAGHGVRSVSVSDTLIESVGTSFSTPIVSTIAANLWQKLELGGSVSEVRPELVKGLLAHSAALGLEARESDHRHYTGWGRPASSTEILSDSPNSFTTIHEVTLNPQTQWILAPFPVPECLLVEGGKFAGEAVLTISYDPPIFAAFGPECVRYEVEGGFGYTTTGATGNGGLKSITAEDLTQTSYWERDQIDDGKWSSLKTFRARFPKGTSRKGGEWGLRLALLQRMQDEVGAPQKAYAILTLRSIGQELDVYADGIKALNALNLSNRVVARTEVLRLRA